MSNVNDPDRTNAPRHTLRFAVMAGVFLLACLAGGARAHFDRLATSARTVAMGGAFTGVADDPSAVLANPAGLALLERTSFLSTYSNPYGTNALDDGHAALGIPARVGVLGISWHGRGGRGVLTEHLVTIAFARHLVATTQDASLSVGASVCMARLSGTSAECPYAENIYTGGVGVLLRPFPVIGIGYSIRNLNEDGFDVPGEEAPSVLKRRQAWGVSYVWSNNVTFSVEWSQAAGGQWLSRAGAEVVALANLRVRGGVGDESKAAGFGLSWGGFRADVALESDSRLGATYVFSVSYLPRVVNPHAQ